VSDKSGDFRDRNVTIAADVLYVRPASPEPSSGEALERNA